MGDLGDRLGRHVDGSAATIGVDEIRTPRTPKHSRARRVAIAAALVSVVGVGSLIATRIGDDDDTQVGENEAADPVDDVDPWAWLDFGTESPTPASADGWKTLENGDHRFSVPEDWTVTNAERICSGASGAVFIETAGSSSCNPKDPLPESFVEISLDGALSTTGPVGDDVLATLTDPGRVRVLQDGPLADTTGWHQVTYEGVAFMVPPSWTVTDLVASYTETRDQNGDVVSRSGKLNPDGCGWFTTPQTFLGTSPLVKACPGGGISLEPGEGIWARALEPSIDLRSTTIANGTVDGMQIEIVTMELGPIADPLHLVVTTDETRILISLGVGLDTSVARAVLHSIRSEDVDPPPPASADPVATCPDVDRFEARMENLGITYDYQASESPEALADAATAVVRGTLLSVREDPGGSPSGTPFAVFALRVDDVAKGDLDVGDEIEVSLSFGPASVPFSSIEESFTPGLDVVVFVDSGPWPGGWGLFLEGFWTQCEDGPAVPLYVPPVFWSHTGTLEELLERTSRPTENPIPIDGAYRADNGSIVVTVTGSPWGYEDCLGAYFADPLEEDGVLTIVATEHFDGNRSLVCPHLGEIHVLAVWGTAEFAGDTVIDAASGETFIVQDGIDDIRPAWFRDREPLPNCGHVAPGEELDEAAAAARKCFADAYNADQPAEFSNASFGRLEASNLLVFRILGDDTYEVFTEFRPELNLRSLTDGRFLWTRWECDVLLFPDPSGSNLEHQPGFSGEEGCREATPS